MSDKKQNKTENAVLNYRFRERREILINYMLIKIDEGDWHAVSDAANDLRVLEAGNK